VETRVNNPDRQPSNHYFRMTHTQQRVMEVCLDNLAGLITPRVSHTKCTVLGTRLREVVTLALMASLSVNLSFTKRENALVNSFIPPLHLVLFLGSFGKILSFSLCNCACSMALSGKFSHFPSAIVLLPLISLRYEFSSFSPTISLAPRLFWALLGSSH
jgi:hypothetical protein